MTHARTVRSGFAGTVATAGAVLLASFGYAVVRYVILGTTPATQIPLYVTNKAVAVTAVVLLGLAVVGRGPEVRRARGLCGAGLAVLHVLLTLPVLGPASFRDLFEDERLSAAAGTGVLLGATASVLLIAVTYPGARWSAIARVRLQWLVVALSGGHLLALGAPGWRVTLERPPAITLVTFLYVLVVLARGLSARRAQRIPAGAATGSATYGFPAGS